MSLRAAALALVWTGAMLLAAVLVQRARSGAWSAASFDDPPPVARWLWPVLVLGLLSVVAGAAVLVRSVV